VLREPPVDEVVVEQDDHTEKVKDERLDVQIDWLHDDIGPVGVSPDKGRIEPYNTERSEALEVLQDGSDQQ
jgi:hypothetical protein